MLTNCTTETTPACDHDCSDHFYRGWSHFLPFPLPHPLHSCPFISTQVYWTSLSPTTWSISSCHGQKLITTESHCSKHEDNGKRMFFTLWNFFFFFITHKDSPYHSLGCDGTSSDYSVQCSQPCSTHRPTSQLRPMSKSMPGVLRDQRLSLCGHSSNQQAIFKEE